MKNILLTLTFLLGSLLPAPVSAQGFKSKDFSKSLKQELLQVRSYSEYEKDLLAQIQKGDAISFKEIYEEATSQGIIFSSKTKAKFLETLSGLKDPNLGVLKTMWLILTPKDITDTFNSAILFDKPIENDSTRDFFVLAILDKVDHNPDNLRVNIPKDENGGRASLLAYWAFKYSSDVNKEKPDARYKLAQLLIKQGASLEETILEEGVTRNIASIIDFYSSTGSSNIVTKQARELVGLPED